jgi:hypothetical protein
MEAMTELYAASMDTARYYRVIINDCPIAVGVGDVVECAASFII